MDCHFTVVPLCKCVIQKPKNLWTHVHAVYSIPLSERKEIENYMYDVVYYYYYTSYSILLVLVAFMDFIQINEVLMLFTNKISIVSSSSSLHLLHDSCIISVVVIMIMTIIIIY